MLRGKRLTTGINFQGVQFEISIDGVPRSYRDRREIAVEAAKRLLVRHEQPSYHLAPKGIAPQLRHLIFSGERNAQ